MHRSQQALSCNVLEGESTQLPEQFEVDKSHAIITMKTMTLYAVLDKVSGQRLGCVIVDKSALRTNKELARFRTIRLTPWQPHPRPDNQFSYVSCCRV